MRKITSINENISISGRMTTIKGELAKANNVYAFELHNKPAKGIEPERYFILVYESAHHAEEFDISKEDFEWIRGMGIPVVLDR